ncbi:MAG TPA: rod-binding protein [Syntrophobacteraceae bacterium]|nr:rod-binding protein [Syntrophobacteraceae bacterium]
MLPGVSPELGVAPMDPELKKKRLKEACREFEAIFANYVLKSMREGIQRAEEPDQARQVYESLRDESLARELSRGPGCGLAELMYRQLLPLVEAGEKPQNPVRNP